MAYTVGSASVEIVPDFRRAQTAITAWFAQQKNEIRIPVNPEMSQAANAKVRQQATNLNRDVAADAASATRKSIIEREQMYSRMFDKIAKDEQRAADNQVKQQQRAETEVQKAIREREQAYAKLFAEVEKRETVAIKEQLRNEAEVRKAVESREQVYARLFDEAEKRQEQSARAAERQAAAELREVERVAAERTRIYQQEMRERERVEREFLREDARAQKKIFDDAFKKPTLAQVRGDKEETKKEATVLGSLFAALFSSTVARNASREIKARSAFLAAVAAASITAGAPLVLAASTVLFGGLGLAATASSREVQETWRGTWSYLTRTARSDAEPFVEIHSQIAGDVVESYNEMRPAIREMFTYAAPEVRAFSDAVLDAAQLALPGLTTAIARSGPTMTGVGDALREIGIGVGDFFAELSEYAPALGNTFELLAQGIGEALPLLADTLGVGAELATAVLPLLNTALKITHGVVELLGPLLPLIAGGFATWRIMQTAAGWLGGVATAIATTTGRIGGFVGASSRFGRAAQNVSRTSGNMGTALGTAGSMAGKFAMALPLLGAAVAVVASIHQEATNKEQEYAQSLLEGGQAAADAAKKYQENEGTWGHAISRAVGLSASWDDVTGKAKELRDAMSPLERAQSDASKAQADLTYATEEYGPRSDEAKAAALRNKDAQIVLAREQREANIAIRDSITAADAAAKAMEDYQAALLAGDTAGAAAALADYKDETILAAEEQRLLNRAIADTVPSSDAAKAALDDVATALRNQDPDAATESLARYKRESYEAAQEQIELDRMLGVVGESFDGMPASASAAEQGIALVGDATGATEAQIDGAIEKIQNWRDELQTVGTAFIDPLDTYRTLLEAKSEEERKAAEATAKMTVSSEDSWRDYLETTTVTLDQYADKLEEQIRNQENWRANVVTVTQRGGVEIGQILADMGVEGAQLTEQMATATTEDFERMKGNLIREAQLAGSGAASALQTEMAVMAAVGKSGASATAREISAQLGIGVAEVLRIASQYGVNLAGGINPILTSLGKRAITASSINTGAGMLGNLWDGGYTGDGGKYEPKAVVHGGEYVFTKEQTAKAGVGYLSELAKSLDGYANGGFVTTDDIPKPSSTAPYRLPISTAGDASMEKMYDEVKSWMEANTEAIMGGVAGAGAVGGAWTSLWNLVKSQIPQARINSTYRPGDPGAHGRNKAIDFGYGTGPGGAGSAGLASINRLLHDQVGRNLYELIYDGIGDDRPDLKRGAATTYNAATRAQHTNHVHAAVYDQGGPIHPGMNIMLNNTGQTEWLSRLGGAASVDRFREMVGQPAFSALGPMSAGQFGSGSSTVAPSMSVAGFVNHGTIQLMDMDAFNRSAENSKTASLARLGII